MALRPELLSAFDPFSIGDRRNLAAFPRCLGSSTSSLGPTAANGFTEPLEEPFELRHALAKSADFALDLLDLASDPLGLASQFSPKRVHLAADLAIGGRDGDQDHDPGADHRP